jgi:hypothetical protein
MYNNGRLIDSFVKCVLPNDDKRVITFNLKNEPVTVPTSEEFDEIEKSSDICAFASPKKNTPSGVFFFCLFVPKANPDEVGGSDVCDGKLCVERSET